MKTPEQSSENKQGKATVSSSFFTPDPKRLAGGNRPQQQGKPLDSLVSGTAGSYFGYDFSKVRVYNNEEGHNLAEQHTASAITYGNHIAFRKGAYRPNTPVGEALLAHELAHVVQQDSRHRDTATLGGQQNDVLEREANTSMLGFMIMRKLGLSGKRRMKLSKSRKRMSACNSYKGIEPPSYLGVHSIEALQEVNRIAENTELLEKIIVVGVVTNTALTSPEEQLAQGGPGDTLEATALALRGIPAIKRNRIHTVIDLLMIQHRNEMNAEEQAFWDRVRTLF